MLHARDSWISIITKWIQMFSSSALEDKKMWIFTFRTANVKQDNELYWSSLCTDCTLCLSAFYCLRVLFIPTFVFWCWWCDDKQLLCVHHLVFQLLGFALPLHHKNQLSKPSGCISMAEEKMSSLAERYWNLSLHWCSIFQFGRQCKQQWPKVSTLMRDYGPVSSCRAHSV